MKEIVHDNSTDSLDLAGAGGYSIHQAGYTSNGLGCSMKPSDHEQVPMQPV